MSIQTIAFFLFKLNVTQFRISSIRTEIPIEKVVINQECELVTLMTRVKGRLEVTSRMFSFIDLDQASEDGENHDFK